MSDAATSHGTVVQDAHQFEDDRAGWRASLGADEALRRQAVDLQVAADAHSYAYTWEWAGVPIIRLPDDVVALQELIWSYKPTHIVETGVARGGSMVLNASLQKLAGIEPKVLGIDIQILPHTWAALDGHPLAEGVTLHEGDSTNDVAKATTKAFLDSAQRALLILDSNHTHDHVLAELRVLAPLLPAGSYVLVADTLVEEFPENHYANRPWGRGNNPYTALQQFLAEESDYELDRFWSRRGLLSEFRDGIARKVN
jgi:cephalosporin hydroxylase